MRARVAMFALMIALLASVEATAQSAPPSEGRPFLFSVSTLPSEVHRTTVHVDSGVGETAFDVSDADRPERRFGMQASLSNRVTLLGRVGLSSDKRDPRAFQQGELLYSVLQAPASHGSLAVGLGLRHEAAGANVMLGRVAAGRSFSNWRLDGNAIFEKSASIRRDSLDLITTVGVSRRLLPALAAGIELVGEDLEGFWARNEAEGGARLLVGPSLRIAPSAGRWQIHLAGGPIIHATRTGRSSDATRGLPSSSSNAAYAARVSLSYSFQND